MELPHEKKVLFFRRNSGVAVAITYKSGLFFVSLAKAAVRCLAWPLLRNSAAIARHWHIVKRSLAF